MTDAMYTRVYDTDLLNLTCRFFESVGVEYKRRYINEPSINGHCHTEFIIFETEEKWENLLTSDIPEEYFTECINTKNKYIKYVRDTFRNLIKTYGGNISANLHFVKCLPEWYLRLIFSMDEEMLHDVLLSNWDVYFLRWQEV